MAEVNTDIYKSLGANNQQMTPMQVLQMIGQMNTNRLFQQTYDARSKLGQAYEQNVDQGGKINYPGLTRDVARSGFLAPEATGQGIQNSTQQFALDTSKLKYAQQTLAAAAAKSDFKKSDIAAWAAGAAQAGVDPSIIHGVLNSVYSTGGSDPKVLRKAALGQGIMSMGTTALEGEAGPPNEEGNIPQIPKGEAIERRAGVVPGQNSSGMVTTNPPGYQEAATTSGQLLGGARARAASYGADVFPMTQLLANLEKLGLTGTGPGTHELNTIKSFVQSNLSWMPGADKIIGDPSKIANYNEAEKYATQLAGSRASQFGHGTDQAMAQSLIGSPNTHISNLAGVDLTKAVIGLRNMEHVQTLEADRLGITPGKFATWAARWAGSVDPRAFMAHLMTKEQLTNIAKSLKTDAERQKFNRSYKMAVENGVIERPAGEYATGE